MKLLIVAPAADLVASLRFVLEAESYAVTTAHSLAEADAAIGEFDCTILDHHLLPGSVAEETSFIRRHRPVVLLANELPHALSDQTFRTLTKPLLGAALSDAVREAIASRAG